ncbi:unnamed protein product [Amoebophrya sp. A25]|nr:unnamed protein product [Amoebophrya sp. A25]|eukprot:GSA25T00013339001.1
MTFSKSTADGSTPGGQHGGGMSMQGTTAEGDPNLDLLVTAQESDLGRGQALVSMGQNAIARGTYFIRNQFLNLRGNSEFAQGQEREVPEGYSTEDYDVQFVLSTVAGVSRLYHAQYIPLGCDCSLLKVYPQAVPRGMDVYSLLSTMYNSKFAAFLPQFGCDFMDDNDCSYAIILEPCYPTWISLSDFVTEFGRLSQTELRCRILARIFARLFAFMRLTHDEGCMGWFDYQTLFVEAGFENLKFFHLGFRHDTNRTRQQKIKDDYLQSALVLDRILGIDTEVGAAGQAYQSADEQTSRTSGGSPTTRLSGLGPPPQSMGASPRPGKPGIKTLGNSPIGGLSTAAVSMGAPPAAATLLEYYNSDSAVGGSDPAGRPSSVFHSPQSSPIKIKRSVKTPQLDPMMPSASIMITQDVNDANYGENFQDPGQYYDRGAPGCHYNNAPDGAATQHQLYNEPGGGDGEQRVHTQDLYHGYDPQMYNQGADQQHAEGGYCDRQYPGYPNAGDGWQDYEYGYGQGAEMTDPHFAQYDGGYNNYEGYHQSSPPSTIAEEGASDAGQQAPTLLQHKSLQDFRRTLHTMNSLDEALGHPFLIEYEAKNRIDLLKKLVRRNGEGFHLSGNLCDSSVIMAALQRLEREDDEGKKAAARGGRRSTVKKRNTTRPSSAQRRTTAAAVNSMAAHEPGSVTRMQTANQQQIVALKSP